MQEHAPLAPTQSALYENLGKYNLTDDLNGTTDYFLVGDIKGIKYYTPNDESWGSIIAVDHKNELAHATGFYEMDDMEYPDSDYAIVCHEGKLMCQFEVD